MKNYSSNPNSFVQFPIPLNICLEAESSLRKNISIVLTNLSLNLACIICIVILLFNYFRMRIVLHGNLLVLFGNIIFLGFINSASYFALYFRHTLRYLLYQEPCELVNYFYQCVLLLTPSYLYYFAYPAFHFCVMVERARATYLADKYEGYGQRLGWQMTFWIWLVSIVCTIILICLAFMDPEISSNPLSIVTLTSKYNSDAIIYIYIIFIPLAIFTACFDWRITVINNRKRAMSKNFHDYSLSRNYQLNENTLAMRLILPLDIFYAILYTFFTALSVVIRIYYKYKQEITKIDYIFYYYTANMLNYIYLTVTTIVYIRFIKFIGQKRKNAYTPQHPSEQSKIYFKQLKAQWQ